MVISDLIKDILNHQKISRRTLESMTESELERFVYSLSFYTRTDDRAHVYDKQGVVIDSFLEK